MSVIITSGNATYCHVLYVTDICDEFIFGLDIPKENKFKFDYENNELL